MELKRIRIKKGKSCVVDKDTHTHIQILQDDLIQWTTQTHLVLMNCVVD